jgi:hypothetical protein
VYAMMISYTPSVCFTFHVRLHTPDLFDLPL